MTSPLHPPAAATVPTSAPAWPLANGYLPPSSVKPVSACAARKYLFVPKSATVLMCNRLLEVLGVGDPSQPAHRRGQDLAEGLVPVFLVQQLGQINTDRDCGHVSPSI